jgi:hypothetical protein
MGLVTIQSRPTRYNFPGNAVGEHCHYPVASFFLAVISIPAIHTNFPSVIEKLLQAKVVVRIECPIYHKVLKI